jgi:hypothetical protein
VAIIWSRAVRTALQLGQEPVQAAVHRHHDGAAPHPPGRCAHLAPLHRHRGGAREELRPLGQGQRRQAAATGERVEDAVGGEQQPLALWPRVGLGRQAVAAHGLELLGAVLQLLLGGGHAQRPRAPHDVRGESLHEVELGQRVPVQGRGPLDAERLGGVVVEGRQAGQEEAAVAASRASRHRGGVEAHHAQAAAQALAHRRQSAAAQPHDAQVGRDVAAQLWQRERTALVPHGSGVAVS